tara:strand:- start:1364 stop:2608 length:1245 start_codon:yes stop_codon:yes gene_type:complete
MRNLNTPTPQEGVGKGKERALLVFCPLVVVVEFFLSDDDIFNSLVKTKTKIRPPKRLEEDKNTHPLLRYGTTTTTTTHTTTFVMKKASGKKTTGARRTNGGDGNPGDAKKKTKNKKTKKETKTTETTEEKGALIPENIFSLFLTQGTLDILLLLTKKEEEEDDEKDDDDDDEREGKEEEKPPSQLLEVKKCEVLKDVRFRGAISDFYCLKEQLIKEEKKNETVFNGETFVLRRNEEDKYGDGNNFELALTAELGEMWKEEAEEKKAEEEAKEKKTYIFEYEPKLWVDLGSALEMEMEKKIENEENDDDHNDVYQDKDDDDKDNDSETFIAHDSGIQSTAELETKSTQVSPTTRVDQYLQYEPRTYESDGVDLEHVLNSKKLELFLKSCEPYVEECLKENESYDILRTEIESLMI